MTKRVRRTSRSKPDGHADPEGGHDNGQADENGDLALDTLVEHCVSAKSIAETQGEHFLAYLLAMVIQEAQAKARAYEMAAEPSGD